MNVIDNKQYRQLQKLLKGSEEDKTLAVSIVDMCDIEKSFVTILCLMSQCRNKVYAYGSELGRCKNLLDYLISLKIEAYIVDIDLMWLMGMYKAHCERHNIKESTEDNKFILNEYQTFEHNPVYSFRAQLNPKKKI
jgi:hypothetical protein